ncbi:endonuclease/exonuclease/phosphatase family protein [Photobacterium damselae]|uniref:endonuclease/exonuclease/phosphatase family protein n=1 Tax=Photobacterium damselae TaxID=38293 RepID=UPI0012AE4020|nr:endonuclease/exonuclease/phosphatase family protein [Photobacterium damselae]
MHNIKPLKLILACIALSPNVTTAEELRIMSWNMQWLNHHASSPVLRDTDDFSQIKSIIEQVDPDILAFQEVGSLKAMTMILPPKQYDILLSSRADHPKYTFPNTNQFTGFAIRKNIRYRELPDFTKINLNKKGLRYGKNLKIWWQDQQIHLLNIHLKAGCKQSKRSKACRQLKKQLKLLSLWLKTRIENNHSYILLGDFNYPLYTSLNNKKEKQHNHWFFKKLGIPTTALKQHKTSFSCQVKIHHKKSQLITYTQPIDHVISEKINISKVETYQYTNKEMSSNQLSDHCPLYFSIP